MNLRKLWEIVKERGARCAAVHGSQGAGHNLVTAQHRTELECINSNKVLEMF